MVAAEVKHVGGRELDRIGYQRPAIHGRLRRRYSRFQQCLVANAAGSTMRGQYFRVNRCDRRDRQMANCGPQDKRLKRAEFFRISRLALAAAFCASMAGRTGVKIIEPPSWTVTVI